MFATLFYLPLVLALFRIVTAQSNFTIDASAFVQCQSTQISWTDTGNAPYDILLVPANDVCGEAIEDLGNQTCNAVSWTVNVASGTQVVLSIQDAAGNEAWSGAITVGSSNDTSCLNSTTGGSVPSSAASGPFITVPPGGGLATPASSSSLLTSSVPTPAGAVNAGLTASSAFSMRPVGTFTLLGSAALAVVAFAL